MPTSTQTSSSVRSRPPAAPRSLKSYTKSLSVLHKVGTSALALLVLCQHTADNAVILSFFVVWCHVECPLACNACSWCQRVDMALVEQTSVNCSCIHVWVQSLTHAFVLCFFREETAGAVWGGPQHPAGVGDRGHPPHLLQLQPTGRLPYLGTLDSSWSHTPTTCLGTSNSHYHAHH